MEKCTIGTMTARGLLLSVLVVALSSVRADEAACSGHGQLVVGKCLCTTPLPTDTSPGWVGSECDILVHQLTLDGKDIEETCVQGHTCNEVNPIKPVCFSTQIAELGSSAFHFNLLLSANITNAVVVLRGLLTNFTDGDYPKSEVPYSFAVQTSSSTQLKLSREQLGYGSYTGLYLCATSNVTTTISLRAAASACPFNLLGNGTMQLCSGRSTSNDCPHGVCSCNPPYLPPAKSVVTPGLGFEDCSTALMPLNTSVPITVSELTPGGWAFFSLELSNTTMGHELFVWAAATEATKGPLVLYLRHQQLPGAAAGQYDLSSASASSPYASSWQNDQSVQLRLHRKQSAFQQGTWYLGVHNRGAGPVSFSIHSAVYDCPNNCSGRGSCNALTAECTCEHTVANSTDCSIAAYELQLGNPITVQPRVFMYDELFLPGIKEKLDAAGPSGLTLKVSFNTSGDNEPAGLPAWVTGRPMVIAAPSVVDLLHKITAEADDGPRRQEPVGPYESLMLSVPGESYSMEISPWAIGVDGSLHMLVFNPLSSPLRQVAYSVEVALQATCPMNCSGHGTCNTTTGECTCDGPFGGRDCSRVCEPGTSRDVRWNGLRGVCWARCRDDGLGFDDQSCDMLQCDGPQEGHGQLRRKGSEVECIEDKCMAGNYTVTDASGDFLCMRSCVCPADGSACAMENSCLPGTMQCLKGLRLSTNGGSCVAAPHEDHRRGVSGGMVFFYCLLSIFLAAGLVVGGKYGVLWYEQYRYGRSVFSQGYVSWPLFGNRGNAGTDDW